MMMAMTDWVEAFDRPLAAGIQAWGLEIEPVQMGRFRAHLKAVIEANRSFNLTRITDLRDAALMHYVDSLSLLGWARDRADEPLSLLDIGTGAGFPAVPIAVMRPEWSVTAIDGTRKKTDFVSQIKIALGLDNLTVEHAHTDHWPSQATFDLVTFRAAGKLGLMLHQVRRFVGSDGYIVAYKSETIDPQELADATQAMSQLGLRVSERFLYHLSSRGHPLRRALHVCCFDRSNNR